MPTGNENLRNALADSVVIVKKGQDKMIEKLDELKPIAPKDAKDYTKDLKAIETAVKEQEVAETVTIKNPEAITGDLKKGLQGIIEALQTELKNFDKNIVVKNDFSNFASLFKSSQDKTSVINALKAIEDKIETPEITDYTMILSDIATAVESREAVELLKEFLSKEYSFDFPAVMAVDLDPNLVENDRVKVVLRKDQVGTMMASASANNLPLIDAIKTGDTWLQQLGLDKDDASNYYFGFKQINTDLWRIKRINKTTYAVDWASGESDADTAWTNRVAQSYGNL